MELINRDLLIITPKKACIDWVNTAFPDDPVYSPNMDDDFGSAYLTPEFESREEALQWLKKSWNIWFETLLIEWCVEPDLWPQNRTWEMLNDFFDIRYQSLVFDTLPLPIEKDED